jgi:hypothetical protein
MKIFAFVLLLLVSKAARDRTRNEISMSKSGAQKRWTYQPESHLNEMYATYLASRGGKANGKSGNAKTGGKPPNKAEILSKCCQVCPYKFHAALVLLELPSDIHRKTLERFREWHMHLLDKKSRQTGSQRLGAAAPDCYDPKYTGRPKPVYRKVSKKGLPGYPGIWECPLVKEPEDAKSVCCDVCPDQVYPPLDLDVATGSMSYGKPKIPDLPKECSQTLKQKRCAKEGFKAGTSCDRGMITCPKSPASFPGVEAACCNLCPEDFKPEIPDSNHEDVRKKPKSFMADENGFVLPNLDDNPSKLPINRCCYLCASADYNSSPGDSVFSEPLSSAERAHNLMLPMAIPDKNYRNQRDYKPTKAGMP